MISFKPQVGKAQTSQTSGGFAVIIPLFFNLIRAITPVDVNFFCLFYKKNLFFLFYTTTFTKYPYQNIYYTCRFIIIIIIIIIMSSSSSSSPSSQYSRFSLSQISSPLSSQVPYTHGSDNIDNSCHHYFFFFCSYPKPKPRCHHHLLLL